MKVRPIKICKISTRSFISYFILDFTSADTIFQKYLELHSRLFEKEIFVSKGGNLTGTNFDHMNPFQSYRQHSVNIGHQLNPVQRV